MEACATKAPATSLNIARQIDFLLIMAAERIARLLAGNGEHRHVIEPRVIKAGDQVRCAGARRGNADAKFAGELGVGRRHERRHFLVARLNELDLAVGTLQGAEHAVDAVAGIAEDLSNAPGMKSLNQKIADSLTHVHKPSAGAGTP